MLQPEGRANAKARRTESARQRGSSVAGLYVAGGGGGGSEKLSGRLEPSTECFVLF